MRKGGGEKQYDPNVWPYRNFHLFVYINLNILKKGLGFSILVPFFYRSFIRKKHLYIIYSYWREWDRVDHVSGKYCNWNSFSHRCIY